MLLCVAACPVTLWALLGDSINDMLSVDAAQQKARLSAILDVLNSTAAKRVTEAIAAVGAPSTPPRNPHVEVKCDRSSSNPKPVKIDASRFSVKEGENLLRWIREVEIAMRARLINDEETKVAFAMSLLAARAKDWAYTEYLADSNRFPTWERFCELMKETFLPPHSDFRLAPSFWVASKASAICTRMYRSCVNLPRASRRTR